MKPNVISTAALLCVMTSAAVAQQPAIASMVDCNAILNAPMDPNMDHAAHRAAIEKCSSAASPTLPGQAAYGAISEVVRILEADPKTDWTAVNIEALRQHLIDMDEVTMRSVVVQRNIEGGFEADVTGTGRTADAIRRMTKNHFAMLDSDPQYRASSVEIPNGVRVTVTAGNRGDAKAVARLRGLGFAGILVEGDHHAPHHLALARGEPVHGR